MKKENSDTLASCSVNADLTENHKPNLMTGMNTAAICAF